LAHRGHDLVPPNVTALCLFLAPAMKAIRNIKESLGRRMLRKESAPARKRSGGNFNSAQKIGILYLDKDEAQYNLIRNYAKYLKEHFDVKQVHALAFVDMPAKKLPAYQTQILESSFFSREDVNWHFKPLKNTDNFIREEFDILLDLSGGNSVPLHYVLKLSLAKMKVGLAGTRGDKYYDFMVNMGNDAPIDKFIEQLNLYLSNPKIK
jgi:hypothetical protein